jgi:uncharacterized protein (TIGR02145 family)
MNHPKSTPIILFCSFLLLLGCEKYEIKPITKVKTVSATAEVVSVNVVGKIIEIGDAGDDFGFCYAKHENPTVFDAKKSLGVPHLGDFSVTIDSLDVNSQYFVRAFCKEGNNYVYGSSITFSTTPGTVTLTSKPVIHIAPTTAVSGGEVLTDMDVPVKQRGVCWSTSQNPTVESSKTVDGNGLGTFTSNLTGLEANTTYYVRAYATNDAGTFYGNEHSFTTLEAGTITDNSGNLYKTVTINGREWFAENLRTTQYFDGTNISTNLDATAWTSATGGAIAIYPVSGVDGITTETQMAIAYGVLYNWHAVNDARGICPFGWRIPTDEEWSEMTEFVGNTPGTKLKSCLQYNSPLGGDCATTVHPRWDYDAVFAGQNTVGFSALPAGIRNQNGIFADIGYKASWWTAKPQGENFAWYRTMYNNFSDIERGVEVKSLGMSVRCIKK